MAPQCPRPTPTLLPATPLHRSEFSELLIISVELALCVIGAASNLADNAIPPRVRVRILGVGGERPLRDVRSDALGKFMSLRGNVVRVGVVRPLVTCMQFTCGRCGTSVEQRMEDGK